MLKKLIRNMIIDILDTQVEALFYNHLQSYYDFKVDDRISSRIDTYILELRSEEVARAASDILNREEVLDGLVLRLKNKQLN